MDATYAYYNQLQRQTAFAEAWPLTLSPNMLNMTPPPSYILRLRLPSTLRADALQQRLPAHALLDLSTPLAAPVDDELAHPRLPE